MCPQQAGDGKSASENQDFCEQQPTRNQQRLTKHQVRVQFAAVVRAVTHLRAGIAQASIGWQLGHAHHDLGRRVYTCRPCGPPAHLKGVRRCCSSDDDQAKRVHRDAACCFSDPLT